MVGALSSLLLLAAAHTAELTTPLGSSARPIHCLPNADPSSDDERSPDAPRTGPWDRLRERALAELCLGLARAQVQLVAHPDVVLAAARELQRTWPGRPEPWVLEARAHTRLNAHAKAWVSWQAARERGYDFRAAYALRDYGIAAAMNGHTEVALDTYRRLISLLSLWPDPKGAQRLYLEAAAAALRHGRTNVDEAAGYVAGARPDATSTGLRAYVAALDALVMHRRGNAVSDVERVDAAEVWHFVAQLRSERAPSYWAVIPQHEICGAASLLIEKYSLTEATELWELYTRGLERTAADAAVTDLARRRLAGLKGRGEHRP